MTAASVFAPAFGAYIGGFWGWRVTFLAASGIGVFALLVQMMALPRMMPAATAGLGAFVLLLRRFDIRIALFAGTLLISGYFAAFTYIRPFMEQIPRLDTKMISIVLMAVGIGGFIGNLAGGFVAGRSARLSAALAALILTVAALALLAYGSSTIVALIAVTILGLGFGAVPMSIQTWTVQIAPDHAESVGALMMSTFQVAIAVGAIAGGLLVDHLGAPGAVGYCASAALASGLTIFFLGRAGRSPA